MHHYYEALGLFSYLPYLLNNVRRAEGGHTEVYYILKVACSSEESSWPFFLWLLILSSHLVTHENAFLMNDICILASLT